MVALVLVPVLAPVLALRWILPLRNTSQEVRGPAWQSTSAVRLLRLSAAGWSGKMPDQRPPRRKQQALWLVAARTRREAFFIAWVAPVVSRWPKTWGCVRDCVCVCVCLWGDGTDAFP